MLAELRDQLAGVRGVLKAITLHQPWAWAILHAGKTVENRTWSLPAWMVGKWVALHAGAPQRTEADDAEWIWTTFGLRVPASTGRGVVGLVKFGPAFAGPRWHKSKWEFGPWCWPVTAAVALPEPIAARGAQGFWVVPSDVTEQVLAQLAREADGVSHAR